MDNSFVVKNLLDKEEGTRLEFKSILSISDISKVISSMINTEGGDILVGVDDAGRPLGLDDIENNLNRLRNHIIKYINPDAPISYFQVKYKGKDLLLISTWEGSKKPYQYKGKIYVRENDRTKMSDFNSISSLISERKNADFHWERRTVLGAEINELNSKELDITFRAYINQNPNDLIEDAEDFLINTGLISNGTLTNAAIILFCAFPIKYIPQSTIRITLYPSKKMGNRFIGDRIFKGSLFENIKDALEYLEIVYGRTIEVNDNVRFEKFNYPQLAIREALLNAIVHRDYNSVNSFIQVNIFSDRTEISNYGRLPEGISIADLRREHNSILRNPDIAQMCFVRRYIEMLGSGTLRMIDDCKRNGFKTPEWQEEEKAVIVLFDGVYHTSLNKEMNEGVKDGVSEGVKSLYFEDLSEGVNESLNQVYRVLDDFPETNAKEIAQRIGKGISTTERYLKILKDNNIVVFIGAPRTGGYVLKKHIL